MSDQEVMRMALDWIEAQPEPRMIGAWERIKALRAALAQPEPEPVAWYVRFDSGRADLSAIPISDARRAMWESAGKRFTVTPLYTAPPQRPWVGLTDEEVKKIYTATEIKVDENWRTGDKSMMFPTTLYEAIEAKLKEKNSAT